MPISRELDTPPEAIAAWLLPDSPSSCAAPCRRRDRSVPGVWGFGFSVLALRVVTVRGVGFRGLVGYQVAAWALGFRVRAEASFKVRGCGV